jgi:hypothetical protein
MKPKMDSDVLATIVGVSMMIFGAASIVAYEALGTPSWMVGLAFLGLLALFPGTIFAPLLVLELVKCNPDPPTHWKYYKAESDNDEMWRRYYI